MCLLVHVQEFPSDKYLEMRLQVTWQVMFDAGK